MIPIALPYISKEEGELVAQTVTSGWVTQGPKVQEFEERFAQYVGAKFAVAVSSCTAALHLCFLIAEIGEGDEVICPSMSFIATANAIKYAGAMPIFAEVEPATYNLDVEDVERKITPKTKAILPVHQMGMPADLTLLSALAEKHNLKIIEDAACAAGSSYQGERIGSYSDLVCFSFHPRKVITTGEGGMICTSDETIYKRLRQLRQHGMSLSDRERHESDKITNEQYPVLGFNYRMTDIQATLGISQLYKLDYIVQQRRKIASKYIEGFANNSSIVLPDERERDICNYQSFAIYLNDSRKVSRDELMQILLENKISSRRGIMLIHEEKPYSASINLPVSEDLSHNSLLIPLYVGMTDEEIQKVITVINDSLN